MAEAQADRERVSVAFAASLGQGWRAGRQASGAIKDWHETRSRRRMADNRSRRGGDIVVAVVQGFARAVARQPEKRTFLDFTRSLAAGDRFDLPRLCRARLVRSDCASASRSPHQLAIRGGGLVHCLRAWP